MQMAGDLARLPARPVAQGQRSNRKRRDEVAAYRADRIGIVVACDPDPIAAALERDGRSSVRRRDANWAMPIVKAVAGCDDGPKRVSGEDQRQPRKRTGSGIGWQHHASRSEAETF